MKGPYIKTIRHSLDIIFRGHFLQSGIPWLRRHGFPIPMSSAAYAFDTYKRKRLSSVPSQDLSTLQWPNVPGLVSIVLPVFNGEDLVGEAIESILAQTYPSWELIIVDDGSTDGTSKILDKYAERDSRIRVIYQENQKLPRALARGFMNALGEYFTWTSDDNRLYPEFLERMVASLKRHPSWDFIYANQDIIGEEGKPLLDSSWYRGYQTPLGSSHIYLPKDPSELNTIANNYLGAAFLYCQRVAGLLGDYNSFRYTVEDYDYGMRVNALFNLKHADFSEPVYAYRFHTRSLTSQEKILNIRLNSKKLLVFDDFRREFYLTPLLWWLEKTDGNSTRGYAVSLHQLIRKYNHLTVQNELYSPNTLPGLWVPIVYVQIVANAIETRPIPTALPRSALKVLVVVGSGIHLPSEMPQEWDMCVTTENSTFLPRLLKPYQGWVTAPNVDLLFTALDIKTRSHHLTFIEERIAETNHSKLKLSVIICTYQRGKRLENAIASVAGQGYPIHDYELIVVNNDPEDHEIYQRIGSLRNQYYKDFPNQMRLVNCPLPGLGNARNAGLSEARGQVICFLDDDAVAQPGWLESIWRAFYDHPEAGVIGGDIQLKLPDPAPFWWGADLKVYWSHFMPGYSTFTWVEQWWKFPYGANWYSRQQALLDIGGFRTPYSRHGRNFGGGDEIVAASLIQKLDYKVGVEPKALVIHDVEPDRFTLQNVGRSILAGRKTWYRGQMDLYLPNELGLLKTLRRIGRAIWPFSLRAFIKLPYLVLIEFVVMIWCLRDWIARFRRPVSMRN